MIFKTMTAAIVAGVLAHGMPAFANEGVVDGVNTPNNPVFTQLPDIDQSADANAPAGGNSYLFIAGSAFTPRISTQVVSYPGGGCAYSDLALTTSLELPSGAVVQGVRLYYYSTSSANKVFALLTSYPGDGSSSDALSTPSTFATGYSSEYFSLSTPLTISPVSRSYVLSSLMDVGTRLCGMRVFYTG